MEQSTEIVDDEKLLAFANDILVVLKNQKDTETISVTAECSESLRFRTDEEFHKTRQEMEEYERKVGACMQKIKDAESETISDEVMELLEKELETVIELERELHREFREIEHELAGLEKQRVLIEERKVEVLRKQKDASRYSELLSMCASTTKIIPDLEDQTKISGYIVDRSKKKCEKFEFELLSSPVETCNKLWKMVEMT